MDAPVAQVFDIARGSTHDGPGLRTTVFFKGCPLRCSWCQNPEGLRAGREIGWEAGQCIRCLECVAACPAMALSDGPGGIVRASSACTRCGACVDACPARAMEWTGREWTLEALVAEALKDAEYYRASGGGVTVSGGEPLSQHTFVRAFLQRLRAHGVRTALDTCGWAPAAAFAAVLAHSDLVLFDLKLMDPVLHERYTSQSNARILENLTAMAAAARATGAPRLWIRTPLIPGVTATAANLRAMGALLQARFGDVVERWELCAFNGVCAAKYRKLGLNWTFADLPAMSRDDIEAARTAALSAGWDRAKLLVSGWVAKEGVRE